MGLAAAIMGGIACGDQSFDSQRQVVIAIFEAACERGAMCGNVENIDTCVNNWVGLVCGAIDCNAEPIASDQDINACIDAYEDLVCGAEKAPAECADIIGSGS